MQALKTHYDIVVLDSGIDTEHTFFKGIASDIHSVTLEYNSSSQQMMLVADKPDTFGHGTALTGAILKIAPSSSVLSINFYYGQMQLDEQALLSALRFIAQNVSGDFLNLSLGIRVCTQKQALYEACSQLNRKGFTIFAAFDGTGTLTYPACFDHVLGVLTGRFCRRIQDFEFFEGDPVVNLGACGASQRLPWKNNSYRICSGCSYSCAYAAAYAASHLPKRNRSIESVLKLFRKTAKWIYHAPKQKRIDRDSLFPISRAAVFPFNKEIHSLVRYSEMLLFELTSVYDSKYSMQVGARTKDLLPGEQSSDYQIQSIERIDYQNFDTLILGHVDELFQWIGKPNLKGQLVQDILSHNKQIYSFDDLSNFLGDHDSTLVQSPLLDKSCLPPFRYEKLFRIATPILGVLGTSPKQGKFTLQILLRKKLLERGFQVGQIGTEPSALLFGMDYVYPLGYNSEHAVSLTNYESIRYLNCILHEMEWKEKDILLVGSQSATVTQYPGNLYSYPLYQHHFLLGTCPDCVVLCINYWDPLDYIARTIRFIESAVDCKIIAFVVFPVVQARDWAGEYGVKSTLTSEEHHRLAEKLWGRFHLPVFRLGIDSEMERLTDQIISFFTSN